MAVYYKFKSAKDFDSLSIEGHAITVGNLKSMIFESKQLGKGTDYDLVVINAQTNEEYLDESALIPKSSSVLIRRLPEPPHKPIVARPVTTQEELVIKNKCDSDSKKSFLGAGQSAMNHVDDLDDDAFGKDVYDIPEVAPVTLGNKAEEERKVQELVKTSSLARQQTFCAFGRSRGLWHGMGGHGIGGRGFGRGAFEPQKPPEGYVCHRCKNPGHFIHHCPTNRDSTFDIKMVKPNVADFENEIKGMSTTRNVNEPPPELYCPFCKQVMRDAVFTSTCCFRSFCDKCIREHIISNGKCVCGATDKLADNLVPNYTVRHTIMRILGAHNRIQGDSETAHVLQKEVLEKGKNIKVPEVSETKNDSRIMKESEAGKKKKKKKKVNLPEYAAEIQYNPYLNGMDPYCGVVPPYMWYGLGPSNFSYGVQAMMPPQITPHRDSFKDLESPRDATNSRVVSSMNVISYIRAIDKCNNYDLSLRLSILEKLHVQTYFQTLSF